MNTTLHFLRHGQTLKDPSTPPLDWSITEAAKIELREFAKQNRFKNISHIYSSTERKAIESAQPFANEFGLELNIVDGLEEVHRGSNYLPDKEFHALKQHKLEHRDSKPDGGETSNEALARFKKAIADIEARHENAEILISSHGSILALYFSDLNGDFENIFAYWKNLPFGAVGVVKDSQIVEDISYINRG